MFESLYSKRKKRVVKKKKKCHNSWVFFKIGKPWFAPASRPDPYKYTLISFLGIRTIDSLFIPSYVRHGNFTFHPNLPQEHFD